MDHHSQSDLSARETLHRIIDGYQLSELVYVAAELGIADLMKDGPKHYEDLANVSGTHPQALYRLLRALSSVGVFNQLEGNRFELNALADCLRSDVFESLRPWAIFTGNQLYPTWGNLLHSIKTGGAAFDGLHGMSVWQYYTQNPHARRMFNEAMSAGVSFIAHVAMDAYDFSRFHTVVDVGGGQGVLLATILKATPSVQGILFDQPEAIQGARDLLATAGLLERCELVEGNFLEAVPRGGDAYILSRVIHDWDDQEAIRILKNCRRAMKDGGQVLIVERVIQSDLQTEGTALADITMMVIYGGRERVDTEYRALLTAAGFELTNVISTHSSLTILEGRAV